MNDAKYQIKKISIFLRKNHFRYRDVKIDAYILAKVITFGKIKYNYKLIFWSKYSGYNGAFYLFSYPAETLMFSGYVKDLEKLK